MNQKIITATLIFGFALVGLTANAQTKTITVTNYVTITNTAPAITIGNSGHMPMDEVKANSMPMELTLGAAGITNPKTGETSFGLDVGLSVQPFKKLPVWVGIAQGVAWEPSFSGSTDLDAAWSLDLIKDKLSLNVGWAGGATYDRSSIGWRTGPELQLDYYTSGNAFIYVGANYDLFSHTTSGGWETAGANAFRYSAGIGIAF